jgi:hypothetical protein
MILVSGNVAQTNESEGIVGIHVGCDVDLARVSDDLSHEDEGISIRANLHASWVGIGVIDEQVVARNIDKNIVDEFEDKISSVVDDAEPESE